MSDPACETPRGPRLVRAEEAGAPAPVGPEPARPLQRLLLGAGLVLLVALLLWGGFEARRARSLERRVGQLSGELAAARSELLAHRRHLEAIRGGVVDVESSLAALRALVERRPEDAEGRALRARPEAPPPQTRVEP